MNAPRTLPLGAAAALLALAGCAANTGVETTPTFVPARLTQSPPPLPQPDPLPLYRARRTGAQAVAASLRARVVEATDLEMDGNTWRVEDVDHTATYRIATAPFEPTTILLPPGEGITDFVSGGTSGRDGQPDFNVAAATAGDRAAITVMPACAHPKSERFKPDGEIPIKQCLNGRASLHVITSRQPYRFDLVVNDWTAVPIVELNHAPPPRTDPELREMAPPMPNGEASPLWVLPGDGGPGWKPVRAWADPLKLVIEFTAPLPTLPALFAGQEGEQTVNYRAVETGRSVFLVTDRRVTEAELRIDSERVRITAEKPTAAFRPARGARLDDR